MPGLDGATTSRRLRVIRPDVPIIWMSGRDEAEIRARHGDLSPAGFLAKPYSLRDLRSVLDGVFAP
jgi:DNA-binding response OmpR family regulator